MPTPTNRFVELWNHGREHGGEELRVGRLDLVNHHNDVLVGKCVGHLL